MSEIQYKIDHKEGDFITFIIKSKVNHLSTNKVKIDLNKFQNYVSPFYGFHPIHKRIMAHMVEPDGSILVADTHYFRPIICDYMFDCQIHNKKYGCKFNLGPESKEFLSRNYNCRCFAKIATQSDLDFYMTRQGNNDNAKVYKFILDFCKSS